MSSSKADIAHTVLDKKVYKFEKTYKKIKICYIVLTCKKYLETRVKWQKATCFKDVSDCYFLSSTKKAPDVYGWDTADDYASCIDKYIKFFQNLDLDYDWYMFVDDDTFVYTNRVEQYLTTFDPNQTVYHGFMWSHIDDLRYMSGGAGFFLTKSTYKEVRKFLLEPENALIRSKEKPHNGDVLMGIWIREINRKNDYKIKLISDPHNLRIGGVELNKDLLNCLTFHYVNSEELFLKYYNFVDADPRLIEPKYIKSIPKDGTKVIISIDPLTIKKALRHAYYNISSNPYVENKDFYFTIKNTEKGYVFESVNYKGFFIAPFEQRLIITETHKEHIFWDLQPGNSGHILISKSNNPEWVKKRLTVNSDKQGLAFLSKANQETPGETTVILNQEFYFFKLFELLQG